MGTENIRDDMEITKEFINNGINELKDTLRDLLSVYEKSTSNDEKGKLEFLIGVIVDRLSIQTKKTKGRHGK